MVTAHDNEADEPQPELITIECHGDAAREAIELAALKAAVLDTEACMHPEDMRIATLGGPGSFDCAACGFSVSTLSEVEPEPEPVEETTPIEPAPTGIVEHVDGQRITFHEDGLHIATIWQPARDKDGKAPDFANWYTVNNAGTTSGKNCIALARDAIKRELDR